MNERCRSVAVGWRRRGVSSSRRPRSERIAIPDAKTARPRVSDAATAPVLKVTGPVMSLVVQSCTVTRFCPRLVTFALQVTSSISPDGPCGPAGPVAPCGPAGPRGPAGQLWGATPVPLSAIVGKAPALLVPTSSVAARAPLLAGVNCTPIQQVWVGWRIVP
jgi:hypothetical protein